MKIVVAPDSFKGSMTAQQAARAMKAGARRVFPDAEIVSVPLADGGEGTLEALATDGDVLFKTERVKDPMGNTVEASWGISPAGHAIIEMAIASGISLIDPAHRNALEASSFGTGQLIKAALNARCREIVLGIGGSATTDGGIGALSALGLFARDSQSRILPSGGGSLKRLATIDLKFFDARLDKTSFTILCDVTNPLWGPNGAAQVYAAQKGATPKEIIVLDEGLINLANVVAQLTGKNNSHVAGAGAAGGIGFGLMAFCDCVEFQSGIDFVLKHLRFADKIKSANLILTGEGSIDAQTLKGKSITGVCNTAREQAIPVIGFGGQVTLNPAALKVLGLKSAFALNDGSKTVEYCFSNAELLLENCVAKVLKQL